jgi:hypothetical protein
MRSYITSKVLIVVTVLALTSSMLAAGPSAMLEPNGAVAVNSKPVSRMSTVFTGDKVTTGTKSGAMLSGHGNTVLLAANSSLTVGPKTVTLDQGGASMTLQPGQSAQVAQLTLTATQDGPASYDVSRGCGFVEITAKSGKITVAENGKVETLSAPGKRKFEVNRNASDCGGGLTDNQAAAIVIPTAVASGLIIWYTTGETSHTHP